MGENFTHHMPLLCPFISPAKCKLLPVPAPLEVAFSDVAFADVTDPAILHNLAERSWDPVAANLSLGDTATEFTGLV